MVEIARECGAAGKFPGSGGAVLGVVDVAGMVAKGSLPGLAGGDPTARVAAATEVLRAAYHNEGYVFILLRPQEPTA